MHENHIEKIWKGCCEKLDNNLPNWKNDIEKMGQTNAAMKRKRGETWSDDEVFESILRAILSNATDWSKIENVLPKLKEKFNNYSLSQFAIATEHDIDSDIIPWFRNEKAGSMTLARDLKNLIKTSRRLVEWAKERGASADSFFSQSVSEAGDVIGAVMMLGTPGSKYKLPALGIPIAAEAMRNLGYELAKPDRHICRALGSFGLVEFSNWKDRSGTKNPRAKPEELFRVMKKMEEIAQQLKLSPIFVDNAIWILCAKMYSKNELYLRNDQLMQF